MTKSIRNLLLFIASISLYLSVISPLYVGSNSTYLPLPSTGIVALMKKDKDLDQTLAQAESLSNQAKNLNDKYNGIDEDSRKKLLAMVPNDIDPIRLVNEVNTIVNTSGFNLDNITYTKNDADNIIGEGVKSYSVNMLLQGSYSSFKVLVKNFESSLRLYNIKSINFTSPEKPTDPMTFQVKLETYYLK